MTRRGVAGVRLCHADPCKYPAGKCPLHGLPMVGTQAWIQGSTKSGNYNRHPNDYVTCVCGYVLCSCPAEPQPYKLSVRDVDEPPKDALPEGWMLAAHGVCWHVSGAEVRPSIDLDCWFWWSAPIVGSPSCEDPKPTRELAMAAALQSVEPALRPGWQWNEGDKRWDHKGINATAYQSKARTWVAIKWGGRAEPGHPTLEAAQIRAEALSRGEP